MQISQNGSGVFSERMATLVRRFPRLYDHANLSRMSVSGKALGAKKNRTGHQDMTIAEGISGERKHCGGYNLHGLLRHSAYKPKRFSRFDCKLDMESVFDQMQTLQIPFRLVCVAGMQTVKT